MRCRDAGRTAARLTIVVLLIAVSIFPASTGQVYKDINTTAQFDTGTKNGVTTETDRYNQSADTLELDFPYACKDDSLEAYYRCENNAYDETYNYNGTLGDAGAQPTYNANGKFGGCYYFDGGDEIQCDAAGNNEDATGNISICCWVKCSGMTEQNIICNFDTSSPYNGFQIKKEALATGNQATFFMDFGATYGYRRGTTNISDSQWHMVCGVKNASSIELFVDGSREWGVGANNTGNWQSGEMTYMGRSPNPAGAKYIGYLDEVKIYNRTLTASEISYMYNAGNQYVSSGSWTSTNYTIGDDRMLETIMVNMTDGNSTNYVDKIELRCCVNGSVFTTCDTDFNESTTFNATDFDNGFNCTRNCLFNITMYLIGDGAHTLTITCLNYTSSQIEDCNETMIIWSDAYWSQVNYSYYVTNNWSDEYNVMDYDFNTYTTWVRAVAHPTNGYKAVMTMINETGEETIFASVWNGSAWTPGETISHNGLIDKYRWGDIAIEHDSGEVVVFYGNDSATDDYLYFKVWNGTDWEAESWIDTNIPGGVIYWVRAEAAPDDDEIAVIISDSDYLFAYIWNGTNLTNKKQLDDDVSDGTGADYYECFDVAYEQDTGDALFVWGHDTGTGIESRNWTSDAWDNQNNQTVTTGDEVTNIKARANHSGEQIAIATADQGKDLNVVFWNGSQFWGVNELNTGIESKAFCFDLLYESMAGDEGRIMCTYGLFSGMYYREWTGAAWGAQTAFEEGPTDDPYAVEMCINDTGYIFCGVFDDQKDINSWLWNGTSWDWKVEHSTSVANRDEWTVPLDLVHGMLSYETMNVTSSVDAITPYNQTDDVALSITSENATFIELWYRYSADNSSFSPWEKSANDTTAPFAFTFTFSNGTGRYQFYSRAGNITASIYEDAPAENDTQCFYNTYPQIQNLTATPSSQTNTSYVNITVNLVDPDAINAQYINISYPNGTYMNTTMTAGTPYYYNTTYNLEGTYNATVWCNDTYDWGNTSALLWFNITDADPVIANETAAPSTAVNGSYINISATITDDVGVYGAWVNVSYPNGTYTNTTMTAGTPYYYNTTYNLEGTYNATVWANDTADQETQSSLIWFNITDDDPVLSGLAAAPSTAVNGSAVNVTVTATDDVSIANIFVNISYPNGTYMNTTMTSGSGNTYYYVAYYNLNGTYNATVWCNDTAGQGAIAGPVWWNITKLPAVGPGTTYVKPQPNISFTYEIDGDMVFFKYTGDKGVVQDFRWNFGDGTGTTGSDKMEPIHTYTECGNFTVIMEAKTIYGYTVVIEETISIGEGLLCVDGPILHLFGLEYPMYIFLASGMVLMASGASNKKLLLSQETRLTLGFLLLLVGIIAMAMVLGLLPKINFGV